MNRRQFLFSTSALVTFSAAQAAFPGLSIGTASAAEGVIENFNHQWLIEHARGLAAERYASRQNTVPEAIRQLSYDQYRDIRFKSDATLWLTDTHRFSLDLFLAGFVFNNPVRIWFVEGGQARSIGYDPDLFEFGPLVADSIPGGPIPYSGFRVRYPINKTGVQDEVAVFQGASYFRAIGGGELYGLSARGLAIRTGAPEGEEFPAFTQFWIEKPAATATALVVHALLDSPSTTGAYRFTIRPGDATIFDVEVTLFPRVDINHVGLAPFSSMFLFSDNNRHRFDDYREAVHDSDGLAMWSGSGEWLWRPITNPVTLQISAFADVGARGFGLVQRARSYTDYQDAEARYQLRPSAWVEPIGDWGEGQVVLVEIPTRQEVHDNIAAYWRPKGTLEAGRQFNFAYRLTWDALPPQRYDGAIVASTRVGQSLRNDNRQFVIDFTFPGGLPDNIEIDASGSAGKLQHVTGHATPAPNTWRVAFELVTGNETNIDLRVSLLSGGEPVSETWLYRWTAA